MDAVLYLRVSKDRQQRGKSVTQQEDEARLACAALGWNIVTVFSDNDRSASRYARQDREGYAELRNYIDERTVGVVVLWETSRGSRELEDWAGFLNLCKRRGTLIHVVSHGRTYDMSNARDRKSLQEDGVDAEYEAEKTRERILRNVRANATAGRPHGKLSFGYTRVYDERGNFVEQVERSEQGAILREMARRVLAGESLYAIAADLNGRNVPSPGGAGSGWHPSEVKRLLLNPAYIGKRVLRGQVVGDAVWPAILDPDDHPQLVALLNDPARKTVTDPSIKHLLSGLMKCDECGSGRLTPLKNRGYPGYTCRAKFCVAVRATHIEDFVTGLVIGRLKQPDAALAFAPRDESTVDTDAAATELAKLKARQKEYVKRQVLGEISMDALIEAEALLAPLIADATRRATPPPPRSAALRKLTAPGANVDAIWKTMDLMARREVIQTLVELRIAKGRRGARSLDPARLGASRWVGDDRTWAELWASENAA